MSKELEALENMRADIIDFRDIIENSSYSTNEDYEIVKQALKRNEPMKVDLITECDWFYNCPNCKGYNVMERSSYCPDCGQCLDWSED